MKARIYDLAGADAAVRFSPYCWRVRLAAAHKGIEAEFLPWRFIEKSRLDAEGPNAGTAPFMVWKGRGYDSSDAIVDAFETMAPEAPSLFGGKAGKALTRFYKHWTERSIHPLILPAIILDIEAALDEDNRAYFRKSREARLGAPLEEIAARAPACLAQLPGILAPLRARVKEAPFIGGQAPLYADYIVYSAFQWAHCISDRVQLDPASPEGAWFARIGALYDGLGQNAPVFRRQS